MFVIKTYTAPDQYGGTGVFAAEDVKKGDVVWRHNEETTRILTIEQYKTAYAADEKMAFYLRQYSYPDFMEVDGVEQRVIVLEQGNPCFTNHSEDDPTIGWIGIDHTNHALRDIAEGEEITFNYFDFVDDLTEWTDVQTCTQFLMDQGRFKKTDPFKKAA